jgi:hypothetical protein
MLLKCDPYRVWCSIFYAKLVNCILLRSLFVFVKYMRNIEVILNRTKDISMSPRWVIHLSQWFIMVCLWLCCSLERQIEQGSPNQEKWVTSSPWFQWSRPISVKKWSFSRRYFYFILFMWILEEKVWLLVKKIRTWKDWQGD